MDEVCKNDDGHIVFPPYKKNNTSANKKHEIGSFPNRFQANVPMDFEPSCCEKRVKDAWEEIADFVWKRYISQIAPLGKGTKEIWDRQVRGFWHMQWVLTDDEDDALLDKRKNWRSYIPTVEAGDKCTLFGNLQEISGYVRSSRKGEGEKQKVFWDRMRAKLSLLDLKESERLSAVALIKRLFPRAYNELKGTKLPENFPSTTYMSAISWVKTVVEKDRSSAVDFSREAKELKGYGSEDKAGIQCLDQLARENKDLRDFISLDGNFFYSHTLLNDNLWNNHDRPIREKLERKLKDINKNIGFKADTYYALLSMDGDKMGAILQDHKEEKAQISEAVSTFSKSVPAIIEEHDGRVIYAGGEDVFAILPVDTAIDAAVELKEKYAELFKPVFGSRYIATISAAIIFAHHHAPLNKVYDEVQSLLDKKAKDECGRSSLAICTWNTGGPDLVWGMPWDKFLKGKKGNLMSELAKTFDKAYKAEGISHSFIYNIRRDFSLFSSEDNDICLKKEEMADVLTAEYIRSKAKDDENTKLNKDEIRLLMKNLIEICTPYYRDKYGEIQKRRGFNIDGALLVKFLARRWQR